MSQFEAKLWESACETAVVTREDAIVIYNRMLKRRKDIETKGHQVLNESHKTC
jgi:hypothetical protein